MDIMKVQVREPGLDLIRAGAITAVLAYHVPAAAMHATSIVIPGALPALGGAGVSAFFALSGLLIGRVLLRLSEQPSMAAW